MKIIVFIHIMLACITISHAQKDKVKFTLGLTTGRVTTIYDDIESTGYGFSNQAWYDTVHGQNFHHKIRTYKGINLAFHTGIHIPILKTNSFSFGINPQIEFGRLLQTSREPYEYINPEDVDYKAIGRWSFSAQGLGFMRYSFRLEEDNHIELKLLGGYRYYQFRDKFYTPVVGLGFGVERFNLIFIYNTARQKFYRQLSNGTLEVAQSTHEIRFLFTFFIWKNK